MTEKIEKILVIRLDRLGDLVLSLPAFVSLRKNFPKAKITALVNKPFGEMLLAHCFADETIEFDSEKNNSLAKKAAFLFALSKRRFDLVLDFQHARNDFAALALMFTNAKTKVGYAVGLRRFSSTNALKCEEQMLFERDYPLRLLESLGLKTTKQVRFSTGKTTAAKVLAFLKKQKKDGKFVALHAGVSGDVPEKAWPKENFAELAKMLHKKLGAIVFLTGTKKEDALLDFIVEKSNGAAVKATNFSLNETIEFMKKLDLFITNNTGPMHIAMALGRPTIVLNAFSNPKRWMPKKGNFKMLVKKPGCWPCETGRRINCKNAFICIRGVSVQDAFKAANEILKVKKVS